MNTPRTPYPAPEAIEAEYKALVKLDKQALVEMYASQYRVIDARELKTWSKSHLASSILHNKHSKAAMQAWSEKFC